MKTNNQAPPTGGGGKLKTKTINVPAGATIDTEIDEEAFVSAEANISVSSGFITVVGITEASVTSFASSLIDNNNNSLCYNNNSVGTTNLLFPVLDFGSSKSMGQMEIHWYSGSFIANTFIVQYKENESDPWQDTAQINGQWTGDRDVPQVVDLSGINMRYSRIWCISGASSSWMAINEIRYKEASGNYITQDVVAVDGLNAYATGGTYKIENTLNTSVEVTIKYL